MIPTFNYLDKRNKRFFQELDPMFDPKKENPGAVTPGLKPSKLLAIIVVKIRAYLANGEDRLVPKNDASRHKDLDTSVDDIFYIEKFCAILFGDDIKGLGKFDTEAALKNDLKEHELIYQKYYWKGPGIYLHWLPSENRLIYRSDILLNRELNFMFDLEEHLMINSEGELDKKFIELSRNRTLMELKFWKFLEWESSIMPFKG